MQRVAIKITFKSTIVTTFNGGDSSSNMLNEVRIFYMENHSCNKNLEDVINMPNFLFILLELVEDVELLKNIIEAKLHFFQIASAIKYLHCTRRSVTGT